MYLVDWKTYTKHTNLVICGFFGDYRWLSNFHVCPVEFERIVYPSSENAYQAAKTTNLLTRLDFSKMTPGQAKRAGQTIGFDKMEWQSRSVQVMFDILKDKFERNEDVKELLIATGDKYLEETNHWGDDFWGVDKSYYETPGKKPGLNVLGKLLMEVRRRLLFQVKFVENGNFDA